ncbi:hypothetical protein [Arthrobacter oryzae]|uniref:Uncharacterized protein n=1 Tax=Arthrobacter oryzae TaxID=409290 RepID=A0A495E6L7_9MICC|nr:hypothetical protein [Arthrobacter oryzae]RKR12582.1 hypothetical protein C8D78_3835 [Arthrobacter oryzae]
MTAAPAAPPATLLRRAALLAGILAVIAGFLGMHILAGFHAGHSRAPHWDAAATSAAVPHDMPAGLDSAGHSAAMESAAGTSAAAIPASAASATAGGTPTPASCTCQGGCAEKPAAHPECTPFASSASLSAPPPGTTMALARPWAATAAAQWSASQHIPDSPTPNDLSISRT